MFAQIEEWLQGRVKLQEALKALWPAEKDLLQEEEAAVLKKEEAVGG